jgi:hypothetical protein
MLRRAAFFALLAAAGCGSCRDKQSARGHESAASAADAMLEAKVAELPWKGALVARVLGHDVLSLDRLKDGLVLRSGLYVYRVKNDGALERFGGPSDYRPILPDEDQELAGYDARPVSLANAIVAGQATRPFLHLPERPGNALGWDGQAWKALSSDSAPAPEYSRQNAHFFYAHPDAGPPKEGLPEAYAWLDHTVMKDGRVLWLGYKDADDDSEFGVAVTQPGQKGRLIPLPKDDAHAHETARPRCEIVDSADGETYLHCSWFNRAGYGDDADASFLRLDGDGFTRVFAPALGDAGSMGHLMPHAATAVDAEGALWVPQTDGGHVSLRRIGKDRVEQTFDLPSARSDFTAPSFAADEIATARKGASADTDYRQWTSVRIESAAAPSPLSGVFRILPRSNDVWVIGREQQGSSVLYRFARSATSPTPILIRSQTDQQNEVRNSRGLRRWVGHCATVFVPFPSTSASADGGADAFFASRKAAIDGVVTKMDHPTKGRADVVVIEGMLADRRVSGVLFMRSVPEATEEAMEAAATRLGAIVTTNPASPPSITCSVPVLERLVHAYETHHGDAVYDGE